MTERNPDVTLHTLHEDLIAGFRSDEAGFTQLDVRLREQHLETQQALHALVEGQRLLIDGQRTLIDGQHMLIDGQHMLIDGQRLLIDGQRTMVDGQRGLSADIKALIARIDALIRGRDNGEPAA